jgi:DNA-binding response OmpR family regulator
MTITNSSGVRRILVADDDPSILKLLAFNLCLDGLLVETVDNGVDACIQAERTMPDVIILDVMMPGRDGLGAIEVLKSNELTKNIPVVLLTAKSTDDDVWQGWQAGADYYLTKPFDIDELMQFIDHLC